MTTEPITRLILELGRLPGIGERSAARLAYYIIKESRASAVHGHSMAGDLAAALLHVQEQVRLCGLCQNFCTSELCRICTDTRRDAAVVCVVEGVADVRALEQSGAHRGVYHVLHGTLAPLEGRGPEALRIQELIGRLQAPTPVREVIMATNANVEGEATALYLSRLVKSCGIVVTRLAAGIPLGGELEYLDHATLGRALADRRAF